MKHLSQYITEAFITEKQFEILQRTKVIPLSHLDPKAATIILYSGQKDGDKSDDVLFGKHASVAVDKLKAAQTEIIPEKAVQMALGMMLGKDLKIGGDLGSIISDDHYIMDGHHRWAATYLCDPSSHVEAMQINIPGVALVSVLNIITAGKYNRQGNPGKGNIKDFTGKVIGAILDDYILNGIPGQFPMTAEQVWERLGRVPGAQGDVDKGKHLMMKNADRLPKGIMPGAPARVDMPVIGPDEVHEVVRLINSGVVDITKPYSLETEEVLNK